MSETYVTEIQPRYRDLDTNGHVNQAVYASYLEVARTELWMEHVATDFQESPMALVNQELSYRRGITLGDDVEVTTEITAIGDSSITMEHEILANGEVSCEATVVIVGFDPETEQAVSLPDEWRAGFDQFVR